jgi:hypothetical protein
MAYDTNEFRYKPALRLVGGLVIRNLDEATEFARRYEATRNVVRRDGLVHKLEGAHTAEEMADAANAFRAWIEGEGLLVGFTE